MITPSQIIDFYFQHNIRLCFWPAIGDLKGPRDKGWTEKTYTRDEYKEGMRVGFMCGQEFTPGRHLTDIDIDWAPGYKIALALLPPTDFGFGRTNKTVSHVCYTTPEPIASFKYEDPTDKTVLIEIRGTKLDGTLGNQTMCPPSIWSRGDLREPLGFVLEELKLPTHYDAISKVVQTTCMSAISMLLARHFGAQGFGHETRLVWAGFLLRAGFSEDECLRMGLAILDHTGNKDKGDVKLSIESTAKRLAKDDKKVKGGPALAKLLGPKGALIIKRINEWLGRDSDFIRNDKGQIIKNSYENIVRALRLLDTELSYNAFSDKPLVNRIEPLEDHHVNELWFRIQEDFHFQPEYTFFERVLNRAVRTNVFHPVREYLDSLQWDGLPRINEWLVLSGGAPNTPYVYAVSAIVLIAAVRRIRKPGVKFDEMIVLESKQGLQKSSALRALCPFEEWFSDDFELGVSSQKIIESTQGKWIIEASELSGMRPTQIELLKSTLSRQIDGPARMAYAHLPMERPRQFIIVGTTNSKAYLADPTGGRRFWPVEVQNFNLEWLLKFRDQLWAEAAHREQAGESIRLPEPLWPVASEKQEFRRELDPWEALIIPALLDETSFHDYKDGHSRVITSYLWDAVGVTPDRRTKRDQMRLTDIMQRLGFERAKIRPPGEEASNGFKSTEPGWLARMRDQDRAADTTNPLQTKTAGRDDYAF
jgi:predicted P-loop ATPase